MLINQMTFRMMYARNEERESEAEDSIDSKWDFDYYPLLKALDNNTKHHFCEGIRLGFQNQWKDAFNQYNLALSYSLKGPRDDLEIDANEMPAYNCCLKIFRALVCCQATKCIWEFSDNRKVDVSEYLNQCQAIMGEITETNEIGKLRRQYTKLFVMLFVNIYNDIGLLYALMEEYEKAKVCYEAALKIGYSLHASTLAVLYLNLGAIYNKLQNYLEAKKCSKEAVIKFNLTGDTNSLKSRCYLNLAFACSKLNDHASCEKYYSKAAKAAEDSYSIPEQKLALEWLGDCSFHFKCDYKKARYWYKKASELSNDYEQQRLLLKIQQTDAKLASTVAKQGTSECSSSDGDDMNEQEDVLRTSQGSLDSVIVTPSLPPRDQRNSAKKIKNIRHRSDKSNHPIHKKQEFIAAGLGTYSETYDNPADILSIPEPVVGVANQKDFDEVDAEQSKREATFSEESSSDDYETAKEDSELKNPNPRTFKNSKVNQSPTIESLKSADSSRKKRRKGKLPKWRHSEVDSQRKGLLDASDSDVSDKDESEDRQNVEHEMRRQLRLSTDETQPSTSADPYLIPRRANEDNLKTTEGGVEPIYATIGKNVPVSKNDQNGLDSESTDDSADGDNEGSNRVRSCICLIL